MAGDRWSMIDDRNIRSSIFHLRSSFLQGKDRARELSAHSKSLQNLRSGDRRQSIESRDSRARILHAPGIERLRQNDNATHGRRLGKTGWRRDLSRRSLPGIRRAKNIRQAGKARHGHGVSVLRLVAAYDGLRERLVSTQTARYEH